MSDHITKSKAGDAKLLSFYDQQKDKPPGENWVVMSNAIIRSAQGLTLKEKQILMLAISKLDSSKPYLRANPLPTVKIKAIEFADAYSASNPYRDLKLAGDRLYERSVAFHKRNETGKLVVAGRCRWIGEQKYYEREGEIELIFWPKIIPHLMGLRKRFTSYQIKQAATLRSQYSWRLLELLTQMEKLGTESVLNIPLDEFCEAMEATEKQRSDFASVRRKIINPAVAELIEKDNWLINWTPKKRGRKVDSLQFRYQRNKQGRMF